MNPINLIAMVTTLIAQRRVMPHAKWWPGHRSLTGEMVPDARTLLDIPWLNLRFSLALTIASHKLGSPRAS